MTTLLHISDTHFGTEQSPVVEALVALAEARRPDVLVFSGDVTQRARAAQFDAARRFCERLRIAQMLVLPGNHDVPLFNLAARLWRPYGGYLRVFGPQLEPELDLPDMLLIGVNTTRALRHKDGEVSGAQSDRVARRLREARLTRSGQLRVVVTHQPAAVVRPGDVHDRLHGGPQALAAWRDAGADLVLGGHIHLPYAVEASAAVDAQPAQTHTPLWCVQAGTAVSARVRHGTRNSVNLIHWEKGASPCACRLERCDYEPGAGFQPQQDVVLPLQAR
jgi:3',5'-cyclic AMP phosphodiesterase CpdA